MAVPREIIFSPWYPSASRLPSPSSICALLKASAPGTAIAVPLVSTPPCDLALWYAAGMTKAIKVQATQGHN